MGRAYFGRNERGEKVWCDTPEGEAKMRAAAAREAAEREREQAEYEASLPSGIEMLEAAIANAGEAGVGHEEIQECVARALADRVDGEPEEGWTMWCALDLMNLESREHGSVPRHVWLAQRAGQE